MPSLEKVDGTPGLWRDPAWTKGMPGVYALIVGASHYPHLQGGAGPADDTLGLGQLVSSAATAAAFFEWLRNGFRLSDVPVVWCYLLLSPTTGEKAGMAQDIQGHHADADYANVNRAIQTWAGHLPSGATATTSRSLFFFSGHGVQSNWDQQLLPSDYLNSDTGAVQLENCIDTRELRNWMESHPAGEHLALIDACRNEFSPLARKGARGHTVFPVNAPGGNSPRTAAMLSATSPNSIAYQVGGRPHTFFGQAVLEALYAARGAADTKLDFRSLVACVQPRINELLREAGGATLTQAARQSIDGDEAMVVTEIPPGPQARAPAFPASTPSATDGLERADMTTAWTAHVWQPDMLIYSLADGKPIDNGARVITARRNSDGSIVQVDLELTPRRGGVLLVFERPDVEAGRLALRLPTNEGINVPIRLMVSRGRAAGDLMVKVRKLEAWLGTQYSGDFMIDNAVREAEEARLRLTRMSPSNTAPLQLLEVIQRTLRIATRDNLPFFADSLDMLNRQARFLLRQALPDDAAREAHEMVRRITAFLDVAIPAGDFVAFRITAKLTDKLTANIINKMAISI